MKLMIKRLGTLLFSLMMALTMGLGGCGSDTNGNDDGGFDGQAGPDGCQGAGERLLSVVGNPENILRPGEQADLKVFLFERCLGAVAGETINFQITSNPGDSNLSTSSAPTAASGLASVVFTAGSTAGQYQVHASSTSDPEGVYFHIIIKNVVHALSAVGATTLTCHTGESLDLTVKVLDVTNAASPLAVQGASVTFTIVNGPPGRDATIPSPTAITTASGLATATFVAGTVEGGPYVVSVEEPGKPSRVQYNITVSPRQGCTSSAECPAGQVCLNGSCTETSGEDCTSDDQCPEGYHCEDGYCRPDGSLPDSCDDHPDCPPGYYCENHRCYPCDEGSTIPACQDPNNGCETDADCPPGFECKNGFCVPKNDDTTVIPELSGTWYTEHYFNIGAALPGFDGTVQSVLGTLDQLLNHCPDGCEDFVCDYVPIFCETVADAACPTFCGLLDEYIPSWAGKLINILYNLSEMLRELRTEGEMVLSHSNPRSVINGTEDWDKILIRYPEACCPDLSQCNYQAQPGWPECSYIDISRQELDWADVGIRVHAFNGEVDVDDSGNITIYTLVIPERVAEIEFKKFVAFLVDFLVEIFLGYDDLGAALEDFIDCPAIQNTIEDIFGSWVPDLTDLCEDFKPNAGDMIAGLLNQISVDWSIMEFGGWATITAPSGNPPYAVQLGDSNHESSGDGYWEGTFNVIVNGDIDGNWFGER
ncbi:MAG: hypothetical protein JRF33_14235 [Deltaproteobacteria bacterium]|nr:hypothetical protein [Deltaproteobacteria bacterium]